jgi:DNA helicase-2/ATP-dependent DNA helicase PcrA
MPKHALTLYNAGCRVKHPTWGVGVVRDCYGDGDDQKITVNFPNIGLKRIALKFVSLEKIS